MEMARQSINRRYADGERAISGIRKILNGEDEKKKKMVYLYMLTAVLNDNLEWFLQYKWFVLDANDGNDQQQVTISNRMEYFMGKRNLYYPPFLKNLENFSCAVWKSKIYFVGGSYKIGAWKNIYSNQVFVFDTVSRSWDQTPHPAMNLPRGFRPTVVAAGNKIFVFGGIKFELELDEELDDDEDIGDDLDEWMLNKNTPVWAEYYDGTSTWTYMSGLPRSLVKAMSINTCAVHDQSNRILFWVHFVGLFTYDYDRNIWMEYSAKSSPPHPMAEGPFWSKTVAVVGDFVFWHFQGTIYALDLLCESIRSIYSEPDDWPFYEDPRQPAYSNFLVHVGKGKLCLFTLVQNVLQNVRKTEVESKIWYKRFKIQVCEGQGGGDSSISLELDAHGLIDTDSNFIEAVLEI